MNGQKVDMTNWESWLSTYHKLWSSGDVVWSPEYVVHQPMSILAFSYPRSHCSSSYGTNTKALLAESNCFSNDVQWWDTLLLHLTMVILRSSVMPQYLRSSSQCRVNNVQTIPCIYCFSRGSEMFAQEPPLRNESHTGPPYLWWLYAGTSLIFVSIT